MKLRSLINFGESMPLATGINVLVGEDGRTRISVALLKQEKDIVSTSKIITGIETFENLRQELDKMLVPGARVHLNIEGKGVLTKVDATATTGLTGIFPMIKPDDFIDQRCDGASQSFVTIVRKDLVESLSWLSEKYAVVSMSLGVFVATAIIPFYQDNVIKIGGNVITLADGRIDKVSLTENVSAGTIAIHNEQIAADALLAYASAWNIFLPLEMRRVNGAQWIDGAANEYDSKKQIYKTSRIALIAVLAILILNTATFFWLQSNVGELESASTMSTSRKEENDKRKKTETNILAAYDKIGWKSNDLPLFYADQIGLLVDREVQLLELEIGTTDLEVMRKERKQVYQSDIIKIKGVTSGPMGLRNLTVSLAEYDWVKNITDQRYQFDNKKGKAVFEFYIHIR